MGTKKITFDTRIYKVGAIKAALKDYSRVVNLTMEKNGGTATVTMKNWPDEHDGDVDLEFCNCVLAKTRN